MLTFADKINFIKFIYIFLLGVNILLIHQNLELISQIDSLRNI